MLHVRCTTVWMQTTGAWQVQTTSAGGQRCLRSCMRAVARPCRCTSCCTGWTLMLRWHLGNRETDKLGETLAGRPAWQVLEVSCEDQTGVWPGSASSSLGSCSQLPAARATRSLRRHRLPQRRSQQPCRSHAIWHHRSSWKPCSANPSSSAGGCPAGSAALSGPGAGPGLCYRQLGKPVTITSAAVSLPSGLPPGASGLLITVPAADVAALTAITTKAADSRNQALQLQCLLVPSS